MRTAKSPGQWQPWPAVSSLLGLISMTLSVLSSDGYAMVMSPNKSETAVHGCHCPGDMAVRMREVLARPWVSRSRGLVYVCPLL